MTVNNKQNNSKKMFKYAKGIRLIYIIVCWVHLSNIIYEIIAYLSCQTLFFKVLKCLLGL